MDVNEKTQETERLMKIITRMRYYMNFIFVFLFTGLALGIAILGKTHEYSICMGLAMIILTIVLIIHHNTTKAAMESLLNLKFSLKREKMLKENINSTF